MGWQMPWYTLTDDFDIDFGVDGWHGTNGFIGLTDQAGEQPCPHGHRARASDRLLSSDWL